MLPGHGVKGFRDNLAVFFTFEQVEVRGAVGAFASGALAVGELANRRVIIENVKLNSPEDEGLRVTRFRAAEVTVSDALKLPESS